MKNVQLSAADLKKLHQGDYVENFVKRKDQRLSQLLPHFDLNNNFSVADFACGPGGLSSLIAPSVKHYTGVDFSQEFIEVAAVEAQKNGFKNVLFDCADIVEFCNQRSESYDRAFAMDFSEHIYNPEFVRIFSAIRKSLKSGGRLYLHTPNAEFLIEIFKDRGILTQFPEHVAVRSFAELRPLLIEAGFKELRVEYLPHYIRPLRWLHAISRLPFVGRYFKARMLIDCRAG